MKTYKFSNNNSDFTKELRSKVKSYFADNNLSTSGGTKIIIKTIVMALVYFIPYALLISGLITNVTIMLVAYLIMGIGMAGIGVVTMHDANHGTFSKSKKINSFFAKSLYLTGGYPLNWRFQHNTLHHGYTNVEGHDEDIDPIGLLRFSPHKPLLKIHRYQHIYAWFLYSLMTLSWVTAKDFNRLVKYEKMDDSFGGKKNSFRLFSELIISKIIYYGLFLAVPLLLLPFAWYWVVTGFLLMHLTGGFILSIIFQSAHVVPTSSYPLPNNNEMSHNWMVHQLHTTCDFSPNSKVFSWFIGGLNYQVIHHLFPNISHVHYKRLAPIVHETAQKYNLPYYVNKTFFSAIIEHFKMLKHLGMVKSGIKTEIAQA